MPWNQIKTGMIEGAGVFCWHNCTVIMDKKIKLINCSINWLRAMCHLICRSKRICRQLFLSVTVEGRVKPLRAMLKEGKNMDYKDQILYQIGRIYLEEDDEENAFKFFNLSLAEPNGSAYQTTETYLTIADYRFAQEKYRQAQNYYDSTATVLPADYTDVNKVRRKLVYMTELTNLYEENLWLDT